MSGEEILDKKLHRILKNVFQNENIELNVSMDDVPEWDSLAHIKLLIAIEDQFEITIDFTDTLDMTSMTEIKNIITKYSN